MSINTIQSNIKTHKGDLTKYALFLGGTNVTHDVLLKFDPLRTGYGRLFMVRKPVFLTRNFASDGKLNKFKHILEYANTSITGFGDIQVNFENVQGGYVGKGFEVPVSAQDNGTSFQVTVMEFSGSPVREVLHTWINGTTDLMSGLDHHNGDTTDALLANETAEFIYVATDNTGKNIEYACLFANCFPDGIANDMYEYTSGTHTVATRNITFHCVRYESLQINLVAAKLLDKFKVLTNSLNLYSGHDHVDKSDTLGGAGTSYDVRTGMLAPTKDVTVPSATKYSISSDGQIITTKGAYDPDRPLSNNELAQVFGQ